MLLMRGRLIEPELLDHASLEDARGNLVDIIRLNERFGGHGIIRKMLAGVVVPTDGSPCSTLERLQATRRD